MAYGIGHGNVLTPICQGHHQLNLVVEVFCFWRVGEFQHLPWLTGTNGIRWFIKEKRRFTLGVVTHFTRVRCVISSHTIHPPNRKVCINPLNGNTGLFWRCNNKIHNSPVYYENSYKIIGFMTVHHSRWFPSGAPLENLVHLGAVPYHKESNLALLGP